jgi:hypothetical protein
MEFPFRMNVMIMAREVTVARSSIVIPKFVSMCAKNLESGQMSHDSSGTDPCGKRERDPYITNINHMK